MEWKASFLGIFFLAGVLGTTAGPGDAGARTGGIGTSVAVPDLWSVWNNPGGLAFLESSRAGVFAEDRFLLGVLGFQSLAAVLCTRPGTFGLAVRRCGGSLHQEWASGLAYSRKFAGRLSFGLLIGYQEFRFAEGYGSAGTATFEAGLMYRPDNRWTAAFRCINPVPVRLTQNQLVHLPVVISIGFSRLFDHRLLLATEVEKELQQKPRLRAGAEYRAGKAAAVRVGMATSPWAISAGTGIYAGRFQFDLAVSYQGAIGYSPQAGVQYLFGKKQGN